MRVWHRLPGRDAVIDADVEAVRVQIVQQLAAHLRDQLPHSDLHIRQVEQAEDMDARDHQRVSRCHWIAVTERDRVLGGDRDAIAG